MVFLKVAYIIASVLEIVFHLGDHDRSLTFRCCFHMIAYFVRSGLWAVVIDQIEHYWSDFTETSPSEKMEEASSLRPPPFLY